MLCNEDSVFLYVLMWTYRDSYRRSETTTYTKFFWNFLRQSVDGGKRKRPKGTNLGAQWKDLGKT